METRTGTPPETVFEIAMAMHRLFGLIAAEAEDEQSTLCMTAVGSVLFGVHQLFDDPEAQIIIARAMDAHNNTRQTMKETEH